MGHILRKFNIDPTFSLEIAFGQILRAQVPTNDQLNPRNHIKSKVLWLLIQLHQGDQVLVKLTWSSTWSRLRKWWSNNMLHPCVPTFTQETPRSSNDVWPATTRGFSWSRGTSLCATIPLMKGNSLPFTYMCSINSKLKTTVNSWPVARGVVNLYYIIAQRKVHRSHWRFCTQKQIGLCKFLQNVFIRHGTGNSIFSLCEVWMEKIEVVQHSLHNLPSRAVQWKGWCQRSWGIVVHNCSDNGINFAGAEREMQDAQPILDFSTTWSVVAL